MPINGVSGSTNNPYKINEINNTTLVDKVASGAENSSFNRSNTIETNNNRVSPANPNAENTTNTNTINNGDIGQTIDLMA